MIASGVNVTDALVWSQVALSIGLPVPIIALLVFTSNPRVMGVFANSRWVLCAGAVFTFLVVALNAELLWRTLVG